MPVITLMDPLVYTSRNTPTAMITLTPITTPAKLQEYFRFRYTIYRESRLKSLVENVDCLDKDEHDDRAHHYGWYLKDELAGCVRFIEPDEHRMTIPMLGYMDGEAANSVRAYIAERARLGQPMVEASRFCLTPAHRGLRTAREFVLAMVMTMQPHGYEHGLFDCNISHAPFHKLLGFESIQGPQGFLMRGHGLPSTTMAYHYERVIRAAERNGSGKGFRARVEMSRAA